MTQGCPYRHKCKHIQCKSDSVCQNSNYMICSVFAQMQSYERAAKAQKAAKQAEKRKQQEERRVEIQAQKVEESARLKEKSDEKNMTVSEYKTWLKATSKGMSVPQYKEYSKRLWKRGAIIFCVLLIIGLIRMGFIYVFDREKFYEDYPHYSQAETIEKRF